MDDINIGRFKNLFKVVAITNLITSGVITHEQALVNSAYRHFLKEELQINSNELKKNLEVQEEKGKVFAKVKRNSDEK